MIAPSLLRELQRCVAAPVLSGASTQPYARDFSGLRAVTPAAVVPVQNEEEICAALRLLRSAGVPVTIRGSGFSSNGRALGDGVVLVQQADSGEYIVGDGEVDVSARMRWATLVETLKSHFLAPPVLTYSLQTTIGGTLSAGGYGPASVRFGAQVDHVRRLRLILPDGEARWCSPTEDAELFRFALGGLGRAGVIERVVLETVPYRPLVRLETLTALDVPDCDFFFIDNGRATAGHNVTAGELFRHSGGDVIPRELLHAGAPPRDDAHVHLWCDYFIPAAALRAFLDTEVDRRGLDRMHVLAIAPGRPLRAYTPLATFAEERYFGVGAFYAARANDAQAIGAARVAQRTLLDACLRLGGRPYLCGAHDLSDRDLDAIYGDEHRALERLRTTLDPDGLFNRYDGGGIR